MNTNTPEYALLDEIADSINTWTKEGGEALRKTKQEDIETVLREMLGGLAHSICVALDGGSKMSDKVQLRIVDQDGHELPKYLHELLPNHLSKSPSQPQG